MSLNCRSEVTSTTETRWLAAQSFEILNSLGRVQNVRSNTASNSEASQRPNEQSGEKGWRNWSKLVKISLRFFWSKHLPQVGFRKLCCLRFPDISPEEASASHLSSNDKNISSGRNSEKSSFRSTSPAASLWFVIFVIFGVCWAGVDFSLQTYKDLLHWHYVTYIDHC